MSLGDSFKIRTRASRGRGAITIGSNLFTSPAKEAYGTGNMKSVMNGALTIGTIEAAADPFLFGLTAVEWAILHARTLRRTRRGAAGSGRVRPTTERATTEAG
ncbi:MAG: glycogen/starch/alpha-glucan phosphorylase [Nitrospirae bacterium]|nr:glycogen/starch/alpha-glucan phosphorylase [Nitrospirota bacterium]